MNTQNIPTKLQQFTDILNKFVEKSDIAKEINEKYEFIHKINESRLKLSKRFEIRK